MYIIFNGLLILQFTVGIIEDF
nr:unnamed protein product [Callosobruchus analis]